MGRLKTVPARLSGPPPKLATLPVDKAGVERQRNAFNPLRALYRSARWAKLRWATLVQDLFTCQMCGLGPQADTSKLVADHRRPHRGDLVLFWDPENIETLCASPCHSKHKQKLEQAAEYR
jgi:5-methylcytosine-specific restriction protein A